MDVAFFITCIVSLFAVVDPVGIVPVFLSMIPNAGGRQARVAAVLAASVATVTLLLFILFGDRVLRLFGIGIPAFHASGGILLLLMGISMLGGEMSSAKRSASEETESSVEQGQSMAIVPLGIPILSGPGAISTVILLGQRANGVAGKLELALAVLLVMGFACVLMVSSHQVSRLLGPMGVRIVRRIMGLVLTAIAVQFMADGLVQLFPGLAG